MKRLISRLILVGLLSPAQAGQSEDAAFQAALQAAEKQAISKGAQVVIDDIYKQAVGTAVVSSTGQTAGGAVVAGAGVILGVEEYGKAKNDNQRLFATADAVASGITLAFPPAGAIALVCVGVTKIVDGILAAQSAAVVLRYRQLEVEYLNQYTGIKQRLAGAENSALQHYVDSYHAAQSAYDEANAQAIKYCKDIDKSRSSSDVETCLASTSKAVMFILAQADAMEGFLDEVDKSTDTQQTFAQNHIDLETQRAEVTALRKTFERKSAELDDAYKKFAAAKTNFILKQIREKHMTTPIESAMRDCNGRLDEYIAKMSMALGLLHSNWRQAAAINANAGLGLKFAEFDIGSVASEADDLQAGPCFDITPSDIQSTSQVVQIAGSNFFAGRDQFGDLLNQLHSELVKYQ